MYVALNHNAKGETFVVAVTHELDAAIEAAKDAEDAWTTWLEVQTSSGSVVWES